MRRAVPILAAIAIHAAADPAPAGPPTPFALTPLGSRLVADAGRGFVEPSGLARADDGFWSVSDNVAAVFRLDGRGAVARRVKGGENQFEGVARDPSGALVTVRETGDELFRIDPRTGETLARRALADMEGYDRVALLRSDPDKGLEGVTVDPATGVIYAVIENGPRLLVAISADLERIVWSRVLTAASGFAAPGVADAKLDVSGLDVDPRDGALWIVSDAGRSLFRYDPRSGTAVGARLEDDRGGLVKNAEGVAFDPARNEIHVITDDKARSRLHRYRIDPAR